MYGADDILYFNGGLFADAAVLNRTPDEIKTLRQAAELNLARGAGGGF